MGIQACCFTFSYFFTLWYETISETWRFYCLQRQEKLQDGEPRAVHIMYTPDVASSCLDGW
jgi:hypothetical protein